MQVWRPNAGAVGKYLFYNMCWSHSGLVLHVTTPAEETIWRLHRKNNGKGENVLESHQCHCIYGMHSGELLPLEAKIKRCAIMEQFKYFLLREKSSDTSVCKTL